MTNANNSKVFFNALKLVTELAAANIAPDEEGFEELRAEQVNAINLIESYIKQVEMLHQASAVAALPLVLDKIKDHTERRNETHVTTKKNRNQWDE